MGKINRSHPGVIAKAPGKVNLVLEVGGLIEPDRRGQVADASASGGLKRGYHELTTVYMGLDVGEVVCCSGADPTDPWFAVQTHCYRLDQGLSSRPRLDLDQQEPSTTGGWGDVCLDVTSCTSAGISPPKVEGLCLDPQESELMATVALEDNLVHQAAVALQDLYTHSSPGKPDRLLGNVRFTVHKHLPIQGGMAGGSADAAAALVALNHFWGLSLSQPELLEVGAQLGSDVPACLLGGVTLGTHRGEQLQVLVDAECSAPQPPLHWVILVTKHKLSTAKVFAHLDELRQTVPPRAPGTSTPRAVSDQVDYSSVKIGSDALSRSGLSLEQVDWYNPNQVAGLLRNDLESAALSLVPELATVCSYLHSHGYPHSVISGSGPTIAVLLTHSRQVSTLLQDLHQQIQQHTPVGEQLRYAFATTGPAPGAKVLRS